MQKQMFTTAARLTRRSCASQSLRCLVRTTSTTNKSPSHHHLVVAPAHPSLSASRRLLSTSAGNSTGTPSPTTARVNGNVDEDTFEPVPPVDGLNTDMAEGIADATHMYICYGSANQRLKSLADNEGMPVVHKWQSMMQVFLLTQVHVISGLGYPADEQGLAKYAQDLATCLQGAEPSVQEVFADKRRDTWRELVATCFNINKDEIKSLSIVDARNFMHKISSKMIEPSILLKIQTLTAKIEHENPEMEVAMKHQVLQDVIVNDIYLGGNPSVVEEAGFGTGPESYAKVQCAMSDHEGDPLIAQYASSSMMKLWQAAGLDVSSIQGHGV